MTLDELEALAAAATPAPWAHVVRHDHHAAESLAPGWRGGALDGAATPGLEAADYALTAAARNALPALIAVARAAERVRDTPECSEHPGFAQHSHYCETCAAYLRASESLVDALAALR